MGKEQMIREEEFAKKIVKLASEEHLTVRELWDAADIAKGISENSLVEFGSIEKTDFHSKYICDFERPKEIDFKMDIANGVGEAVLSAIRGTYEEVKDSESEDKMEELEKLCIPVEEWMKRNESPYSMVCVTEGKIELFDTSICIPTKKAVD